VTTSLAFSGLRAALRAGLGVTVRLIEMLTPDLRAVTEAEGLPRLPNMHWTFICVTSASVRRAPAVRIDRGGGGAPTCRRENAPAARRGATGCRRRVACRPGSEAGPQPVVIVPQP